MTIFRLLRPPSAPQWWDPVAKELEEAMRRLSMQALDGDRDTDGYPVPTYKAHTFTYDGSGNLQTDTVTDGANTWVKTYTYTSGQQVGDSGWVRQ